ncbi:MAG: TauD/TfdA family dioxygenase [Candidatus Sericytochromatia bacterium]
MNNEDLNYIDFDKDLETLSKYVKEAIKNTGVSIIRNFELSKDDSIFIKFSEILGEPINEERNIDGKTIYRVEINKKLDIPTYANTEYEFWCHTDCSDFDEPPDTIMLLCEKPSETGGETFLISIKEVCEKLSNNDIFLLTHKAFPIRGLIFPILTSVNDELYVRYNRVSIDTSTKIAGIELEPMYLNVINKLDRVINENKFIVKLNKGECLITNNNTILHGRNSFPENSNRLMKRIRLYSN